MNSILQWFGVALVVVGLVFFFGAVVGVVRFPDFYTRMHAAGKGDTLSSLMILAGSVCILMAELEWNHLVSIKILCIIGFIFLTSPTTTHALMQAGYEDGVEPWRKRKSKGKKSK